MRAAVASIGRGGRPPLCGWFRRSLRNGDKRVRPVQCSLLPADNI